MFRESTHTHVFDCRRNLTGSCLSKGLSQAQQQAVLSYRPSVCSCSSIRIVRSQGWKGENVKESARYLWLSSKARKIVESYYVSCGFGNLAGKHLIISICRTVSRLGWGCSSASSFWLFEGLTKKKTLVGHGVIPPKRLMAILKLEPSSHWAPGQHCKRGYPSFIWN